MLWIYWETLFQKEEEESIKEKKEEEEEKKKKVKWKMPTSNPFFHIPFLYKKIYVYTTHKHAHTHTRAHKYACKPELII